MTTRTNLTTRPITRPPAARAPRPSDGPSRLLRAVHCYRHQLVAGAAEILALVEWSDLHDLTDDRVLDRAVRTRLGMAECSKYRIGPFDPNDRVGGAPDSPPTAAQPDRPKSTTATLRALWQSPVGRPEAPR